MTSDSPAPKLDDYVVYLPDGPMANAYPFRLPEGAKVAELEQAVHNQWDGRRDLKDLEIYLYKVAIFITSEH